MSFKPANLTPKKFAEARVRGCSMLPIRGDQNKNPDKSVPI